MEQSNSIYLIIKTRDNILYQGQVQYFSSNNEVGRFDVLRHHGNFISIIDKYVDIVDMQGTQKIIEIEQGLLRVVGDNAQVLLGFGSF